MWPQGHNSPDGSVRLPLCKHRSMKPTPHTLLLIYQEHRPWWQRGCCMTICIAFLHLCESVISKPSLLTFGSMHFFFFFCLLQSDFYINKYICWGSRKLQEVTPSGSSNGSTQFYTKSHVNRNTCSVTWSSFIFSFSLQAASSKCLL